MVPPQTPYEIRKANVYRLLGSSALLPAIARKNSSAHKAMTTPLPVSKVVWKNGVLVSWADATVHLASHGLHYGTGVFEGMRCYDTDHGPAVFRMGAHLDRLFASGAAYGMRWRYTRQDLARAVLDVIRSNDFRECYIRPIAFYGERTLSLDPHGCPIEVAILAWPWKGYLEAAEQRGVNVTISRWRKFSSAAIPATAKACGQYLNSVLATQEAVAGGFDEALLLDAAGAITEGPGENLFLVRNGELTTNDENSSILLGVTRDTVLRLAINMELPVHVRELQLEDLIKADEAFFTGTAAEIAPIARVDGHGIGRQLPGPITKRLQEVFFHVVRGRDLRYLDWLSFVSWG
jgi:branched-chain amino acid aminotransferase